MTLRKLRKDLKMLRYLSEFFVNLWPKAAHDDFLANLRNLQDDLGAVTDLQMGRTHGHAPDETAAQSAARAADDWTALQRRGAWWH